MISTDVKAKIFEGFLKGTARKKLSLNHGVSIRTIERWSAEEEWVSKRSDYFRDHFEKMLKERPDCLVTDSVVQDRLFEFFLEASSEQRAYCSDKISRRQMKFRLGDTIRIARAYADIQLVNLQRAEFARSVGNISSTDAAIELAKTMEKRMALG